MKKNNASTQPAPAAPAGNEPKKGSDLVLAIKVAVIAAAVLAGIWALDHYLVN
jgi:hypothetical protein